MSAAKSEKVIWSGAAALQDYLVPIADLEPSPENPRQGDVAAIAASLRRFGQVRPVLVDGTRIVAGHHLVRAAEREGWTHVAVLQHQFASDEERRAFLLADNRTSDLGSYDDALLVEQLRALADLDGTGYAEADLVALEEALRGPVAPTSFPEIDPAGLATEYECPSCGYSWSGQARPRGDDG